MEIIIKLLIALGWFLTVVSVSVGFWSIIIWLLNRKIINDKGAAAICFMILFAATLLCTRYK